MQCGICHFALLNKNCFCLSLSVSYILLKTKAIISLFIQSFIPVRCRHLCLWHYLVPFLLFCLFVNLSIAFKNVSLGHKVAKGAAPVYYCHGKVVAFMLLFAMLCDSSTLVKCWIFAVFEWSLRDVNTNSFSFWVKQGNDTQWYTNWLLLSVRQACCWKDSNCLS